MEKRKILTSLKRLPYAIRTMFKEKMEEGAYENLIRFDYGGGIMYAVLLETEEISYLVKIKRPKSFDTDDDTSNLKSKSDDDYYEEVNDYDDD